MNPNRHSPNHFALKAGALLCVLALCALITSHGTAIDEATYDAATLAATMIAPAKPATAQAPKPAVKPGLKPAPADDQKPHP